MRYPACLLICALFAYAAAEPVEVTFNRAVQALSAADYVHAEQDLQAVLKQEPKNVAAIGNLGILYARTNRIDKAIARYRQALYLSPDNKPILLNLGLLYFKEDAHSLAIPYFKRVLAIDPGNGQAQQLLDVCLLYTGQIVPALENLKVLAQEHPGDEQTLFLLGFAYLKKGDATSANGLFQKVLEAAGPARAQFFFGRAAYDAALFPKAEESFLEVLHLDPHFPGVHLELGKVYISERRTADAIGQLNAALTEGQTKEEADYLLGSLLVRENWPKEGVPYLEEAEKLKPDSFGVYLYLGKAKFLLGRKAEAVKLLQKAVQLNPDDANGQYTLARALKSTGQDAAAAAAFARVRALRDHAPDNAAIPGIR